MSSLTAAQAAALDHWATSGLGLSIEVLMENAGLLATLEVLDRAPVGSEVLLLVGPGHNGGDALVMARQLHLRGRRPRVLLARPREQLKPATAAAAGVAEALGIKLRPWTERTWCGQPALIVDGLLGAGLRGRLREDWQQTLIEAALLIQRLEAPVVALDLPSGRCADTGDDLGQALRAHLTLTFAARKRGLERQGAEEWAGLVRVIPIGVPVADCPFI